MKNFNQEEERFYNTPLGKLPSVTTILQTVKKVPGAWYSKMAVNYLRENLLDKVFNGEMTLEQFKKLNLDELTRYAKATAKRESDRAADIGTRVHDLIEKYFSSINKPNCTWFVESKLSEPFKNTIFNNAVDGVIVEEDLQNPFDAFLDWANKNDVECLLSEHMVYSRLGYAGTLDFIGMVNGRQYLVDFKSSKGFWPEMPMQVAAYAHAHHEMTGEDIEGAGILRLDKENGMPEWKEVPFYKLGHYLDKFLLILQYFNKGKEPGDKW